MNERFPNELLSAHLDGEMTPGERIVVQRQLAASAEARQDREEIEQISKLLQELPRESAPPGFSAQVMQAIEGPTRPADGDTTLAPAKAGRRRWWWAGVGTTAASVAVLFLAVLLIERLQSPDVPTGIADTSTTRPPLEGDSASEDGLAMAMKGSAPQDSAAEAAGAPAIEEATPQHDAIMFEEKAAQVVPGSEGKAVDRFSKDKAEAPAVDEAPMTEMDAVKEMLAKRAGAGVGGAVAGSRVMGKPAQTTEGWEQLEFNDNLTEVRIGQVVSALQTSGDQIAVVTLTVVDRNAGLDALQVLLERNDVPSQSPPSNQHLKKAEAKPETGGMVAVYVDATPSQLTSTLLGLKRDKQFRSLEQQPAISVASLDPTARMQVEGGSFGVSGRTAHSSLFRSYAVRPGRDKRHEFKTPPGAPVPEEADERTDDRPDHRKSDTGGKKQLAKKTDSQPQQESAKTSENAPQEPEPSAAAVRKLERRSRQVLLSLENEAPVTKPGDVERESTRPSKNGRPAEKPESEALEQQRKGRVADNKSAKLLRVLLVLRVTEPERAAGRAAEPAKPPVPSKEPGDGSA